ncbi:alpha/beta fold hydrolase [Myxococcus sp. NMCA1]|uniref:alpha/beta fold hydrolase n=1 Tax=Myxococcus sp. NMCA1 TaxID=2996785 RepID=UPI0022866249|nr:alpha/beta hydrolase [Myxococcus sp. NMCA1]WAM23815.1 alpha/beta hydrolase [Myxococcus sp. NMCA1]
MRKLLLLCLPLFACVTTKSVPVPASADSSALHQVKRVKVAEGVELELLDFGGQGPALVFLSGLGNTGHVFDTFAPEFTAAHHVYAVTRRGFGSSSWPEQGYDTATLGEDVVRVLEGLGIAKASFVGHSAAGPELTWVATHHPERVEKVVYLDVRTNGDLLAELLSVLPMPPPSEPAPEDVASRAAVAAAVARDVGGAFPAHEIDEASEFDPKTGHYLRDRKWPHAEARVMKGFSKVDFAAVTAPVLFLYVDQPRFGRVEDIPGFSQMDLPVQEKLRTLSARALQRDAEMLSVMSMPNWKGIKLEHARHYVWLTNHDEVLREMKTFLETF